MDLLNSDLPVHPFHAPSPRTAMVLLFLAAVILFQPLQARSQDAPVPARKTEALGELRDKLAAEKTRQKNLKEKMSSAESEMESARKTMVTLGMDLQNNEQTLSTLEKKITALETEQSALAEKLQSDYGSMGNLILALQRIRRMPTETLIIRPGAPLQTAQSALLLQSILPAINTRAEHLSSDIERLRTLHETLDNDRAMAIAADAKLKNQKKEMQALVDRREKFYRQTRSEYDVQAESVARIAAEAKSLQQLVARIDNSEKPQGKTAVKMPSLPGGAWQLPVRGELSARFGDPDEIGAKSQGIKIAARAGALVTAPVAGIVRFAGPFRNYGNLVIIEHDRGFHSLISGLSRIDTAVGRKILAGEPVGMLPASGAEHSPALYYELRYNGKPVDPAAKFPGLS
jgi:septal ring factor EnvC (AmiA/AmiB activator)